MTDPTPALGAFEGREHALPIRVYYEDTDFTGFVYHAGHVRFFERGRTEYMRARGVGHAELLARPDPCAFVVTRMALVFLKAARIDDALVVRTTYDQIRGPRLWVAQRITRGADLLATAEVQIACITETGAPRRPPPDLVARVRPLLADAAVSSTSP
jgi:acyl-CoA thioester hydrolase